MNELYISVSFENNLYTIISEKEYSSSKELIINGLVYYQLTQDNVDIILQEVITNIYIICDSYGLHKLQTTFKDLDNITLLNANLLFYCKADLLFNKYTKKQITNRVNTLSTYQEDHSELSDIMPFIHNSIDRFSYLGGNRDYIRYSINLKKMITQLYDKPIINAQSCSIQTYDKPIGLHDLDFRKISYLMDLYEGVVGIKNLVIDDSDINRLNLFKNLEDEYLYVPFTFLRYLFYKCNVTNIEFENKVIYGTKMYINYRNPFDYTDLRTYSPLTRIYVDFYSFMFALETFSGNLVTCDQLVGDFYLSNSVDSELFDEV